nr:MAG TPA: hypothetical protein [Caudoviricetes sp.]
MEATIEIKRYFDDEDIKDIGVYNLIGTNYSWRKGVEEKTEVQKIIDDEAEKLRGDVSGIILNAVKTAVNGNVAEIISDAIYDILSKNDE